MVCLRNIKGDSLCHGLLAKSSEYMGRNANQNIHAIFTAYISMGG